MNDKIDRYNKSFKLLLYAHTEARASRRDTRTHLELLIEVNCSDGELHTLLHQAAASADMQVVVMSSIALDPKKTAYNDHAFGHPPQTGRSISTTMGLLNFFPLLGQLDSIMAALTMQVSSRPRRPERLSRSHRGEGGFPP